MYPVNLTRLNQLRDQFGKICGEVITILEDYPLSRGSYSTLIVRYWQRFQPKHWKEVSEGKEIAIYLTSPETITRAARKIWEEYGLYLPPKVVMSKRDEREEEMKEIMRE